MIFKGKKKLKELGFKNEGEIQNYFEENLEDIFGYKFIETEFSVDNFRIDTLAFDEATKSFKIIEYKNIKNKSLIDQGFTYLNVLLSRKEAFLLRYNENTNKRLKIKDVNWEETRVIFISTDFSSYQLNATNFKDIPILLYMVKKYENDIIHINEIEKTGNVKIESSPMKTSEANNVIKEIKVYTEEEHLKSKEKEIVKLYETLRETAFELGDIKIEPKKKYIAFKGTRNVFDVVVLKRYIDVYINMSKGKLKDPYNIAEDVSDKGHWGNGAYKVRLSKDESKIDDLMYLLKQSYELNK